MGKAAMCIRMLQVLNTGRVFKISELSDVLNTNPRNIIEYKKELDEVASDYGYGFFIETIPGRYGGYKLNGNVVLPSLVLKLEEKEALLESYNYTMSKKDFPKKKTLTDAFAKVVSNVEIEAKDNNLFVGNKYQLTMDEKDIDERYKFIEKAIELKKTIEIRYLSLTHGEKTHLLDPYKLINYNNSWFFLAWNHEAGDVHSFKINRIKSYKMTEKTFQVWKMFRPENYFDETGFKSNGDYHRVVLIATGTRAMLFKERLYGKNQTVEELDDGSIKVSLDMQNDNTMISFALSCGSEATFLEPQWLIDSIKEKIDLMRKKYE